MGLTKQFPTIRLAGEDESGVISSEIELFIQARLREICPDEVLPWTKRKHLEDAPINARNQTYLWVVVALDLIEHELPVSENVESIIKDLPESVEHAYEKILSRCKDKDRPKAEKLLHIVIGAIRPVTLTEMNIALAVEDSSTTAVALKLYKPKYCRQCDQEPLWSIC